MFPLLHRYPIINLRFILRTFSFYCNLAIILFLAYELFRPVEDAESDQLIQKNKFGGTECAAYRGRLRLPSEMWHVYCKGLGLCFSLWLLIKISVLYFPIFFGNWLYNRQNKLSSYRTTIIIVAAFNMLPLMLLGIFDCVYASYLIFICHFAIFVALIIDRIYVHESDYFQLSIDEEMDMLSTSQWESPRNKKPKEKSSYQSNP